MPDPDIKALKRQLEDMQRATDDRILIAAGTGFAVVFVAFVVAGYFFYGA